MVKTYTATLQGLHATLIEVEIDAVQGTPQLILIGLPSKTVMEAKERITSALVNCGVRMKSRRTIVNLAPADLPKHGSGMELAIAISVLKLSKLIAGSTEEWLFLGELSLNGQIKAIRGALPLCLAAGKMGFKHVVIPQANAAEVGILENISLHPLTHLRQLIGHDFTNQNLATNQNQTTNQNPAATQNQTTTQNPAATQNPAITQNPAATAVKSLPTLSTVGVAQSPASKNLNELAVFDHIIGQEQAKRAITIAAAGGHNLLMVGPPGVGKSLLAETVVKLLPNLNQKKAIEVTAIHSILGLNQGGVITRPPFRAPHHTITKVGLIGGGNQLKPGEISLAHHGVLFLDELTEFDRATIESIRQPLESGFITHARQTGNATYPSQCLLVAATNPCPCGWYQSQHKACHCTPSKRHQYLSKLSGPFLDRIDLQIWVDLPPSNQNLKTNPHYSNPIKMRQKSDQTDLKKQSSITNKIVQAREMQKRVLAKVGKELNSQMNSDDIKKVCQIPDQSWQLLKTAQARLGLSIRGAFNALRVAQTIAQLSGKKTIKPEFLAEALQYRNLTQLES